jgi:serine/threonine protein kinase
MLAVSEDGLQSYQNKQVTFETLLKDNVLKLMDFSVSREIEALEASIHIETTEGKRKIEAKKVKTRARCMSFVGDAVTMAPEVANSEPYGLKADIYSLGVLTYFIVCGKYPFNPGY